LKERLTVETSDAGTTVIIPSGSAVFPVTVLLAKRLNVDVR
jgi:hypothetical protein